MLSMNILIIRFLTVLLLTLVISFTAYNAAYAQQRQPDVMELTLEELMNIEITSVAKKKQKLSEAAAAVYVITQEDIHRSGFTSIPEALRMVPGLQVARIDANKWAVSSRGFNGRFANKLLVLIDGRSVYTPLFSGVFWEYKDTMIEDIDRIEVIRGPGATLWGANAVNGVINIITKSADKSQGVLVTAGAGSEEQGFAGVRYGGKISDNASYRVYGKYFDRDNSVTPAGEEGADDWDMLRGGFRMDWSVSNTNSLTLQGDIYDGELGQLITIPDLNAPQLNRQLVEKPQVSGGNVLIRWQHSFSDRSDFVLQSYYDRGKRAEATIENDRQTFDLDLQHRFGLGSRQEIIWGAGFRFISDEAKSGEIAVFDSPQRDDRLFSAFVQEEIAVIKNKLLLTIGSKFEHNDFTDFEFQPNARLLWQAQERQTVWLAASRAVRIPSRADAEVRLKFRTLPPATSPFAPFPALLTVVGSDEFGAENLLAYEMGYRVRPVDRLSLDAALFYNVYTDIRISSVDMSAISPPIIPLKGTNEMEGETFGFELAADWRMSDKWRLHAVYSHLQMELRTDVAPLPNFPELPERTEGQNPRHQFMIRSQHDLPANMEFNIGIRYVDRLRSLDVDSYIDLDLRLGWSPIQNVNIAITGQNLLDTRHLEFMPDFIDTQATEVERGVYGKIAWGF